MIKSVSSFALHLRLLVVKYLPNQIRYSTKLLQSRSTGEYLLLHIWDLFLRFWICFEKKNHWVGAEMVIEKEKLHLTELHYLSLDWTKRNSSDACYHFPAMLEEPGTGEVYVHRKGLNYMWGLHVSGVISFCLSSSLCNNANHGLILPMVSKVTRRN